jgi:hypothetical protein
MPNSNRPSVSTERLWPSHAAARGRRSGLASTNVATRSVDVALAATASDENGESSCRPSGMSSVE